MENRMRQELDRYITGNYGEDQWSEEGELPTAHEGHVCKKILGTARVYCPADDGPECDIIKNISTNKFVHPQAPRREKR